jgi:hypothetical protein
MKTYKHLFQIIERHTKKVLIEDVFEAYTDDWYCVRHQIADKYRKELPKNIYWAVDSVLMDE